jgi:hypothetical protein
MKGFVSFVLILISAVVLVLTVVAVAKLTLGQNVSETKTTANPKEIQKQVEQFQQKSIENQKINID